MKKHKSSKSNKTTASNSTAELFVLTPELLAKLGINLNNVPNSQIQAPTKSLAEDFDQTISNSSPNHLPENTNTSIIETANLMKESVFLSPTFHQIAPNVISNEEETIEQIINNNDSISTNDHLSKNSNLTIAHNTETEDILMCEEITPEILHDSIIINSNIEKTVNEVDRLEVFGSVKEYQVENKDGTFMLTHVPPYQNIENYKTVEEPLDKTYLSSCSNSYSKCSLQSIDFIKQDSYKEKETSDSVDNNRLQSKNAQYLHVKRSSSNEILKPQLNLAATEQVVYSDSNIVITEKQHESPEIISTNECVDEPVKVSSNSTTAANVQKVISEVSSKNLISWTPADQRENEIVISKIDYDVHNKSVIHIVDTLNTKPQSKDTNILMDSNCTQNVEKNNSVNSPKVDLKLLSSVQENLKYTRANDNMNSPLNNGNHLNNNLISTSTITKIDNKEDNKKDTNVIGNDEPDKVKQIAAYLSQIVKERKNLICRKKKKKLAKAKSDPIKSKLCIQGVEKPGGILIQKDNNIQCVKVTRTYQRPIVRRQFPVLTTMPQKIVNLDAFQLSNNSNNDIHIDVVLKNPNEFCVCHDFGNLAYYDCELLYEHIHFWPQTKIDYDLQTLYSIYNENYDDSFKTNDFNVDRQEKKHTDNERGNLCWNELDINREKSLISLDQGSEIHKEINAATTTSAKSSNKPTRHSTKSGIDMPSSLLQEHSLESDDPLITENTVLSIRKPAHKELDFLPKTMRKTPKADIEPIKNAEKGNMDILTKNNNNEIDVASKSNKESKKIEQDVLTRPRKSSKTDKSPKLSGMSVDSSSKTSNAKSSFTSSNKSTIVDLESETSKLLNTSLDVTNSKKFDKSIPPKKVKSSRNNLLPSATVTNNIADLIPSKLTTNLKANKDTTNPYTKQAKKFESPDTSDKNNKVMKVTITKEIGPSTIDMKTSPRSINSLTGGKKLESASSLSTNSTDTTHIEVDNETPRPTRRSSKISSCLVSSREFTENSELNTKSTKNNLETPIPTKMTFLIDDDNTDQSKDLTDTNEFTRFSKTIQCVASMNKTTGITVSCKETNPVDINTHTKSTKVSEDIHSHDLKSIGPSRKSSDNTDFSEGTKIYDIIPTPKKTSDSESITTNATTDELLNATDDPEKLTKQPSEKLHKLDKIIKSDAISKTLKTLKNTKCYEYHKSSKISSNEMNVLTPTKKAKAKEANNAAKNRISKVSDSELKESPNVLAIIGNSDTKTSNIEPTQSTGKSSVIGGIESCTSKDPLTMNTSTKMQYSFDKEEPTECKRAHSEKNNSKLDIPSDTEVVLSTNSELSECTDMTNENTENYTVVIEIEVPSLTSDNSLKCGVCARSVEESQWIEHIAKEHDYLAWRDGETALDLTDEEAIRHHLQMIGKQNDGLKCSKCGLVRKFAKAFMRHIKNCSGNEQNVSNISTASVDMNSTQEQDNDDSPLSTLKSTKRSRKRKKYGEIPLSSSPSSPPPPITCGVCSLTVEDSAWLEHIRVEHKYLAWKAGEKPVDLADEGEVKTHLQSISKTYGGLICNRCGAKWNYVKKYLVHLSLCVSVINNDPERARKEDLVDVKFKPFVTCGVCKREVEGVNWIKHIQLAHEYMAWIEGETPLDVDDPDQVKEHLTKIAQAAGELVCVKCGTSRIYARAYILHINACTMSGFEMKISKPTTVDKDKYECGVCNEIGNINDWKDHAMKKHYNVAWMVGELPINVRNFYAVERYLKEYNRKYSLICNHCKMTRTSCYGFYAHILTCGKSEEEVNAAHNICEICNNKYLCVYRNQHMACHRDQEHRREMRELKAQKAAEEALKPPEPEPDPQKPTGKRRAAEKAKKVIQKHSSNVVDGKLLCSCGATFENAEELAKHTCTQRKSKPDYDPDVSVKMEQESEEESGDTDVDSTISDCVDEEEEEGPKKERRHRSASSIKIPRLSYKVNNYTAYLSQAYKDFSNLHYTSENLFNEWRNSDFQVVAHDEMEKYLPPLTESCKVRFGSSYNAEWITFKRFEAKKFKGYSVFTGGAIQCMSWVPHNISDETLANYMAVSTHLATDVPRLAPDETPEYPGLVQIWDFAQFNFPPKCVLGLAHDYGIVWAMDWCPSGARDLICSETTEVVIPRLGLLALACSNGTCYILAVPCPPATDEAEFVMYKLKPVAELRLSMSAERRVYQATTVKWSEQKGHNVIIVGYSDGTTALYDLNSESMFLRATNNNDVTVFYPFYDKQSENSSVTGVGIYPTANPAHSLGGYFSTSITGGTLRAWPRAAPSVRGHAAVGAAYASAQWPAVMMSGDTPFMKSVTELEWWCGGRRLGASRAGAGCARCARVAAAAPPALRVLRCHPCYADIKKQIIATLLMVPIGQKRKRKLNDDLSMVVEPLTYEDAVEKYGLQLALVSKNEQAAAQQLCNDNEFSPERFPLSDIVAVAFCLSGRFHDKLAVASHAGIIFILNS